MKPKRAKAVKAWAVWSYDERSWLTDNTDLIIIGARKADVMNAWILASYGECERITRVEIREVR